MTNLANIPQRRADRPTATPKSVMHAASNMRASEFQNPCTAMSKFVIAALTKPMEK
jgi:hypothetical protein